MMQLFEISWEVANKVGGIHTVLSSKARTAVGRYGDDYITVGPLLTGGGGQRVPFDDDPGHEAFIESCRQLHIAVRVGRWRIPGRPRCLLVGFTELYDQKDGVLAGLWERHNVDSIAGGWDYVEPVLFATAAGMVIERWWETFLAPFHRRAVVQAHEWMTAAALLYLADRIPSIGTVFTTHATMLGRALASLGIDPGEGLGDRTPGQLAEEHGVRAKHSMEGVAARKADVFTTVSEITAREAELLHERKVDVILPNGIDLAVVDELAGDARQAVRLDLARVASAFLGESVDGAVFVTLSGRYEFYNKGIELLLDALAQLPADGPKLVAFLLVPAGNSGLRGELRERLDGGVDGVGPLGVCTHYMFDEHKDPIAQHCVRLGFDNAVGKRVKIVHVPIYLRPDDGLFGREYEAVLGAMDLGVYPSFYEPWGYTPQEALALSVPTITTDLAGFGRWAEEQGLGPDSGITVLRRHRVPYADIKTSLADAIEAAVRRPADAALRARCREAAGRTGWQDLFAHYLLAYDMSLASVEKRSKGGVLQFRLPRRALPEPGRGTTPRMAAFEAAAIVPKELQGLERLARNFWWSWNPGVRELFLALANDLAAHGENPLRCLHKAPLEVLDRLASDRGYLQRLADATKRLEDYLAAGPRPVELIAGGAVITGDNPIAYFSAEFGVHSSLPIYSGGLGILAGDHLKSASDLALPLVGVGLFYRYGYMRQQLDSNGQQIAADRENDPQLLAVEPARDRSGRPVTITVPLPGRELHLRAFVAHVGRVPLYLLCANVPQNRPEDRDITRNLYGGDTEMRIQQEIVLGRGGVRLLRAMGLRPSVYHMNEGHAAFLTLERISTMVTRDGLPFDAAREYVADTTMFTTHTPVPAGHDRFGEDLVRRYFGDVEEWVGLPWESFFELGRSGEANEFNMTYLAMQFAGFVNGVSKLHGLASQALLRPFWPGLLQDEVPITTVTNGIHLPTWTHDGIADLLRDGDAPVQAADFAAAGKVAPGELWRAHRECTRRMTEVVRRSLTRAFHERSDSPVVLNGMIEGLEENALYLGFARRFAPYKRAHLLFSDRDRLREILGDADRPVRILVAGKAHPRDGKGQEILKGIVQIARSKEFLGKVLFIEDYDAEMARALVQGVDVWVNTPTRMEEASGTSGMKAAANGVLNLSIADGWWPEAADGDNGWTIGGGRVYENQELQDQADATALYRLIEEELVPAFFELGRDDLPGDWLRRMTHCLQTVPTVFNTDRMVGEYLSEAYRVLAGNYFVQQQEKKAPARERGRQVSRLRGAFGRVRIVGANSVDLADFRAGQHLDVQVDVELGDLGVADVAVELVVERRGSDAVPGARPTVVELTPGEANPSGTYSFTGSHRIETAGSYAHGMRVRARVPGAAASRRIEASLRGLVLWA